jgi:hypothetical protein
LATINELTKDDRRLVRQVATVGQRLQQQLRQLQSEYPLLVADIRGRGLMIGVDLDLEHIANTQAGMLAVMQEHGLLLYMAVSYLLNVEHVRIAPSFTNGTVLRIEPSLIADATLCDRLIESLRRLLDILQRGAAGELLAHLMDGASSPAPSRLGEPGQPQRAISRRALTKERDRFAFVVHLLATGDLRRFDSTLQPFSDEQFTGLRLRIAEFVKPFPLDELAIEATDSSVRRWRADRAAASAIGTSRPLGRRRGSARAKRGRFGQRTRRQRRRTGRFQLDRRRRRPRASGNDRD